MSRVGHNALFNQKWTLAVKEGQWLGQVWVHAQVGTCNVCVVLNGCEGKSERSFFKCSMWWNKSINANLMLILKLASKTMLIWMSKFWCPVREFVLLLALSCGHNKVVLLNIMLNNTSCTLLKIVYIWVCVCVCVCGCVCVAVCVYTCTHSRTHSQLQYQTPCEGIKY